MSRWQSGTPPGAMLTIVQARRKLPLLLYIVSPAGLVQAAPARVVQGDAELAATALRQRLERFGADSVCAVHRERLRCPEAPESFQVMARQCRA